MLHLMACYIYDYICFPFHDFLSFITMAIPLAASVVLSILARPYGFRQEDLFMVVLYKPM